MIYETNLGIVRKNIEIFCTWSKISSCMEHYAKLIIKLKLRNRLIKIAVLFNNNRSNKIKNGTRNYPDTFKI